MCGIIGYIGQDGQALPTIASGLKNLEYRGYDSTGVALNDGEIAVYKRSGVVDDLELPTESAAPRGIGHTRWSTHGKPTDLNAHPHTDEEGQIALVHNGIIENYDGLRAELRDRGHTIRSDTDTEVIVHLIEEELESSDLVTAVERVVSRLDGSFAIAVTAVGYDELVVARLGSPLVVGYGDGANFVGSDVTAFVEHTRRVTYLEDGDVAKITADAVEVRNGGEMADRATRVVDWDPGAAEKGGYEHYMLKEIHEQPQSLRQTLSGRIDTINGVVDLDMDLTREYLRSLEEVQIVACGTSYHAGMYAEQLIEAYADVRATAIRASEYSFTGGRDPLDTLVVAITQSGETADTLSAIRDAAASGARTLAVTNTVGSTVAREVDDTIFTRAGPEIGVAATKTFASQVTTLAMLAVYLGRVRDGISTDEAKAVLENLRGLPGSVQQVLDCESEVQAVAERYVDGDAFFFIGRRLGHPVALEGALKLKEISYDHAEGYPAGELKHGPLALVTEDTPVLALLTDGTGPEETMKNVKEVQARSGRVIGISSDASVEKFVDEHFAVSPLGIVEPLVANVYLQLFAYHVAHLKGESIDKPRNLAKSVTVE